MIDNQKNVDVKQCVKTLIFCVIAILLAMFIPFTYGENTTLSFRVLPVLNEKNIVSFYQTEILSGVISMLGASGVAAETVEVITSTAATVSNIVPYLFFGILLANVLFSLLLIITRFVTVRIIAKTLSVLFGIIMLAIFIVSLATLIGIGYCSVVGDYRPTEFCGSLTSAADYFAACGTIYFVAQTLLSFILIGRQFKWFSKLY